MAKTKAFGGVAIDFSGRRETAEEVFGSKDLAPSEMTKKLWAFVKAHGLMRQGPKGAAQA